MLDSRKAIGMRLGFAALVLSSLAVSSSASAAQPGREGWYLTIGGPVAYTNTSRGPALVAFGAETSLACWLCVRAPNWLGGYADVVYDVGTEQARVTLGPELGMLGFGLDAGLLLAVDDVGTSLGLAGRVMLSLALLHFYVRAGGAFGEAAFTYLEAGLLWKVPLLFPDDPT